ncbi:MAG TPA: CopG family transcriptional regulator [Thermoleophilaceae bacterium]|nr:CopG family transcriptional regulator [Thermoleophilaceae bacterium]
MRRTNIYLSDAQLARLRGAADSRGSTVAAVVREAVEEWLERNGVRAVEADEWSRRFDALLSQRESAADSEDWTQEDVDRDVAEAVAEVRRARAAGRP